jgi:arylsulfatase A-like enzyme
MGVICKHTSSGLTRREVLKYGTCASLAAALSPSLWLTGCRRRQRGKRASIILITVDTLRPDFLTCYGCSRKTSPNIDAFAADSLLFENCLSNAPETRLSFASILSGFLPHETKIAQHMVLQKGVGTLAEILRQIGYKTVAVISNYVLRRTRGYEQGFMIYDDTMNERELVRRWPEKIAEHTTNRAIELLKQFHKEPMFIWIHYQDPHGPYAPPKHFANLFRNPEQKPRYLKVNNSLSGYGGIPHYQRLGKNTDYYYYVSQYEGEIRYQDEHLKRLLDALRQLGLYDSAFTILTSDHGEGMGEHNYYFAHGENLYNHQLHVPLIIKYGKALTGRRTDFVQLMDIIPTVFKIIGMEPDSSYRGRDLCEQYETEREIFAEMNSPLTREKIKFSIVFGGLKLIYTPLYKQYELYELKIDPGEIDNLINAPKYQERAKDLKKRLMRICQEDFLKLQIIDKPQELTDEEIEKLRSLGYTR